MVEAIAQRYGKLPDEVLSADAYNLRHIHILQAAGYFGDGGGGNGALPGSGFDESMLPMETL